MQQLRVDTAALQVMAAKWGAAAGDLTEPAAPTKGLGVSSQLSEAAVNAAHADVAVCTADLAGRVDMRAQHVTDANTWYLNDDSYAVGELAAVNNRRTVL